MTRGDDDTPDDMNSIADMIRGSKRRKRYQSSLMRPRLHPLPPVPDLHPIPVIFRSFMKTGDGCPGRISCTGNLSRAVILQSRRRAGQQPR